MQIVLTGLFVAAHAIAVPFHLALDRAHGLTHLAGHDVIMHVHDDDVARGSHQGQHDERSAGESELFDAAHVGTPHGHEAHAHSVSDHGYTRPRADNMPFAVAAITSAAGDDVQTESRLSIKPGKAPPPDPVHLDLASLRGPPVC